MRHKISSLTNCDPQKDPARSQRVADFYLPPVPADKGIPWEINVYSVTHEPERWQHHTQIANRTYARHGVRTVERDRENATRRYPSFFAEALFEGIVVGGVRVHLPNSSGRLPIQDELDGYVDSLDSLIRELRGALAKARKVLGPEGPSIAKTSSDLGYVYCIPGRYTQAEPVYRRALVICEKIFEPENGEVPRIIQPPGTSGRALVHSNI